ncbi:T6SS immunity protein Tli4 family protein [Paraburkholderia sp. BCC1876]|uniref:T6SS immunity protein Tli4 family protein n=1 Tax=Paraburkholderia sp. BCC1876 TaxID=2676303 RepID=UPI0015903D16|nr:T6SS immunity protein Tli4 family protein [Paraburkholderia sp. BCC1876]
MSESKTQTYCVGRFIVDMPPEAQVNGESNEYIFGRIDSQKIQLDQAGFHQLVKQREADLPKTLDQSHYKIAKSISVGPTAQIIAGSLDLFGKTVYGFDATKLGEGGVLFNLHADPFQPNVFDSVLSRVKEQILGRLQSRSGNTIPNEAGFCIKDGFIPGDGKTDQYEDAGISFKFAKWPGILVSVSTTTVAKAGEPTLLQRVDDAPIPDNLKNLVAQVKTLRKGRRDVNGRHGEELVSSLPTDTGYRLYRFRWEAQGDLDTPLKPTLIVELESGAVSDKGEPVNPKLSEVEALALFDEVVNSLRLRPTSRGAVSEAEPNFASPLGALAQTGSICPQSGWWTCPEAASHQLDGGSRQFFTAGSVLPVARILASPSFVDRLRGARPKYAVNTTWQLVGYEQAAGDGHLGIKPAGPDTPTGS